jgi:hypothetical protein
MQASIYSGCRNDIAVHAGWDTHSSALGLQPQQLYCTLLKNLLLFTVLWKSTDSLLFFFIVTVVLCVLFLSPHLILPEREED